MLKLSIPGYGIVQNSPKGKKSRELIDKSTSSIILTRDNIKDIKDYHIKRLDVYVRSTVNWSNETFNDINEYYYNRNNINYLNELVDSKYYHTLLIDELYTSEIYDPENIQINTSIWIKLFKWLLKSRTAKHLMIICLQNKYRTNFIGEYISYYTQQSDMIETSWSNIYFIKFTNIFESININKSINSYYKYVNKVFKDLYDENSTIGLKQAMLMIPRKNLSSISYSINKIPKNPILLTKYDSNNSSKGGVGGYESINDKVEKLSCDTCKLKGFQCPNHITYVKSEKSLYDYSILESQFNEFGDTFNRLLSWIIYEYYKIYKINTFIYDDNDYDVKNTCKIILNGKVFKSNNITNLFIDSDSINISDTVTFTRKELYISTQKILNHSKLYRWSKKYKISYILKKCKRDFIPIPFPRIYRTPASDGNNLHSAYKQFMVDNDTVDKLLKIMYKTGQDFPSLMDMLRDKHQYLENNLLARRFNSVRRIGSGGVFIHPTEIVLPGFVCDTLLYYVIARKSNIPTLQNSRIKRVVRNGKRIHTNMIKPGDKVYTKITDNEAIGIIKREPVLDEGSLYAAKIRRTEDKSVVSLMISTMSAPQLNGDFDGDEFNAIVSTNYENGKIIYDQMSYENRYLRGYSKFSQIGLHMDAFLFMYIISSTKEFEFPIMNLIMKDKKRHIYPIEKGNKYINTIYKSNKKMKNIIIKDRFIMTKKQLNNIDNKSTDEHKLLKECFDRLNIEKYPFKLIENITYDERVKYLKHCVGFVKMKGYDFLKYILLPFKNINVDVNHKYGKEDFQYNSNNLMTKMFHEYPSNIVLDWLWIVSNITGMFLTHNTQYSTLKIDDIINVNNDTIMNKLNNLEDIIYDSDSSDMLKQYNFSTEPKIKPYDLIKRQKWFNDKTKIIENIESSIIKQNINNNVLYNEATSGSKGNISKFNQIYSTVGPLQNPISILPITLTNQVNCYDDYKNISRYGIIKNSLSTGLDYREYLHMFSIVHIALQQTPLQTKITGGVEKELTPFSQGLFLENGQIVNEYRTLRPFEY